MSDVNRSNKDEFLSYLGTCMSFYTMHLTPSEQSEVIQDIAFILKDAFYVEDKDNLVRELYPGYHVTVSNKI